MFERPKSGERAALVQVAIGVRPDPAAQAEFHLLAESAGAEIIWSRAFIRSEAEPRYLIGKGQATSLAEAVRAQEIELVIFNARLSPSQERNLEKLLQTRVLDRSGLVLDIFARRARSHEGKLQVELAQLEHLSTRLVRGWTHLERQKGGIGLRGPGETQLESDRRLLGIRIRQLKKQLDRVDRRRNETRKNRRRRDIPTVALAGYTNAGKSTLFNRLTKACVGVEDQLFATLDATWRKLALDRAQTILIADTVGFISDLPHELVAAFKSTLQETVHADLILHVIDAADRDHLDREAVVNEVLDSIGAGEVPTILIYNKIDRRGEKSRLIENEKGEVKAVFVSAKSGEGMELLASTIAGYFRRKARRGWLRLLPKEGALRAELFNEKAVIEEKVLEDGSMALYVVLREKRLHQLQCRYNRHFGLHTRYA